MFMKRRKPMCACCVSTLKTYANPGPSQLEGKIKENSEQLRKVKQQLDAQQSERTRIKYVFDCVIMCVCPS
jgi:hypothetical protein